MGAKCDAEEMLDAQLIVAAARPMKRRRIVVALVRKAGLQSLGRTGVAQVLTAT
jgi:hypothetical protein